MECNRCKNKNRMLFEKLYCPDCIDCYYCIKCAHISVFKTCETLENILYFTGEKISYNLKYCLTPMQKQLSNDLITNIKSSNIFINATCGAGKTEIVFEIIKNYVNEKKRVCFVTPRLEVTNELYTRFNKAFNTQFGIITGERKIISGPMFFLTCHQLINYHNIFDLVIVDEADAFPLSNDKVLENAIKLSLRSNGKVIKMSATPLKIEKNYKTLKLFERYHKQSIPVPSFEKNNLEKLKKIFSSGKWIIFFPTIKNLNEIYNQFNDKNIIICHSKITNVSERLSALKDSFVIFSTAILERGITISNINVIVFNAHHNNFKTNTLIQISGRVGRVAPFTTGTVIFMGEYKTRAIVNSINYIGSLND